MKRALNKKLRLAVLCGGPSSERDVSLRSGAQIVKNLRTRYRVARLALPKNPRLLPRFLESKLKNTDLAVLSALHGAWGEDGRIQAMLEALDIPYTGCGVLTSALGMHKVLSYELAAWAGLRVPPYFTLYQPPSSANAIHARIMRSFGYPCVVKPNGSGSSIGVSIVKKPGELATALKCAFAEDKTVIVQQCIRGEEVTCGVIGNAARTELLALPPVLIRTPRGTFFDYKAKYSSARTQELCPAPLQTKTLSAIQANAIKAHALYRCDGLTRSDFILDRNGALHFLEINTAPGMTAASLCPKEAAALGWSFGDLLDNIIKLALAKRNRVP